MKTARPCHVVDLSRHSTWTLSSPRVPHNPCRASRPGQIFSMARISSRASANRRRRLRQTRSTSDDVMTVNHFSSGENEDAVLAKFAIHPIPGKLVPLKTKSEIRASNETRALHSAMPYHSDTKC